MGEAQRRRLAEAAGLAAASSPPTALLDEARQLHRAGANKQALALCVRLLRLHPHHADTLHLCGQLMLSQGQLEPGLRHLRAAVEQAPSDAVFAQTLARARVAAGDAAGALEVLDAAALHQPGLASLQMLRGGILESLGQAEPAARAFMAAAQAEPGLALAHFGAAGQLFKLDRLPEAMAHHERAVALDPRLRVDGRPGFVRVQDGQTPAVDRAALSAAASAACCRAGAGAATSEALQQAVADCELLVVDDFLPDPQAWRDWAQKQTYTDSRTHLHGNFPGQQTVGGFEVPEHMQRIADGIGRDLKWSWPGHGAFRISPAGSLARSDIHVDHGDSRVAYAGVLYLSLPEHCRGGTSFWRHRETGWARAPSPALARASRFGSVGHFIQTQASGQSQPFDHLTGGRNQWDLLFEVPMRFNRLIVYRSDYFHSVSEVFGQGLADGRLVQLFFFEPMSRPTETPEVA